MKKFVRTQNSAKTALRLFVFAFVLAAIFSSCDNMSGNGPASFFFPAGQTTENASSQSQRAIVTFCGSVGVSGALPQEVAAKVSALAKPTAAQAEGSENTAGVSRSAKPDVNPTDYYYYVSAVPKDSSGNTPVYYGKDDQDKFVGGSSGVSYELPLRVGQWIIECGLKSAATDTPVLRASSGLVTLDENESVVSKSFNAVPVSDAGNGSVLLVINKGDASTCQNGSATYKNAAGENVFVALVAANTITDPDYTGYADNVLALKLDDIAPGAYDMTISFYDENHVMLFQTAQTVCVFSGMKTNSWVTDGGTDSETRLITSDGFAITSDALNAFRSSTFYVGDTGSTMPGYRRPSDSNEGTFAAPFATLQKAVDTIRTVGSASTGYTIYVCGTLSENVNFSSALDGSGPTTRKARSITLANLDGSNSAVIEGGGAAGSETIIKVETAVPIKIRGVKITKRASAAYSRGLTINDSNARVTLLEGAEISGNNASTNGGGVYITAGTLCMKGGVIKENTADQGGAVYNLNGAFEISGSAYIPYGDAAGNKGAGKNDVHLAYDSANNVYKYITIAGALNPPDEAGSDKTIATIDADGWNRGKQVLASTAGVNLSQYAGADKKYFAFVDKDAFTTCKASTPTVAKLQAPLYVSPTGLSGNTGSKDSPYDSIATALSHFNDPEEDCVINIDGQVIGTNTISSARCSKLVIQGANGLYEANTVVDGKTIAKGTPKDSLNGNKAGSVLAIDTSVPVVIRNLKIFGGTGFSYGGTSTGGGINMMLNNCDVTLDSGSLVGDVLNPSAPATSADDCGNTAKNGGGVSVSGTLTIKSGAVISHNYTPAPSIGSSCDGGGIVVSSGKVIMEEGAKIIANACGSEGGGIYLQSSCELVMKGGEISGNFSVSNGGAVCNYGTFTMGGTAYIPYGGEEGKNDVYLAYVSNAYKAITIDGSLALPAGKSGASATITPEGWHRGKAIAVGKNDGQLPDTTTNRLKFAADAGDSWESILTSDKKEARIFAPIYVAAGAAYDATTNPGGYRVCGSRGLDSNIGTKSAPYATVTKALPDLAESNSTYKTYPYTVYIDGKVTENLTINSNSGGNVSGVSKIILKGATTNSATLDNLDGGSVSKAWDQANRTLTLQGPVPVSIQYLRISGGKINADGGGILIYDGATLQLGVQSFVTDNYAIGNGAGIYVGGTLEISSDVHVKDNKTRDYSTDANTGDCNVYLPHGKVMTVTGALYGSGQNKSEIYVSAYDEPSITGSGSTATVNTVPVTSGYKDKMSGFAPSQYIKGDKYGALLYSNEAALGLNGGTISVEQPYSNMTLTVNKTYIKKSDLSQTAAWFTISGYVSGNPASFTTTTSNYYVDLSLKLLYHDYEVPTSYYTVSSNKSQMQLLTGLPAGDYVLAGTAVHQGNTYTVSFDIKVVDDAAIPSDCVLTGGETVTGAVGTNNPSSVFIENRKVPIPVLIASKYEVTQSEYEKYCCYYGSFKPSDTYGKGENFPVYQVTWYDAIVYCNLRSMAEGLTPVYSIGGKTNPTQWTGIVAGTGDDLGKYRGPAANNADWNAVAFDQSADGWRLPTEAEWEYLARGANKKDYAYSGSDTITSVAWCYSNSPNKFHQNGNNKTANSLGLFNMSGNVYEWCWDWKDTITSTVPATGPSTGTGKVIRGGSATNNDSNNCNVSARIYTQSAYSSSNDIGFRVVRTPR